RCLVWHKWKGKRKRSELIDRSLRCQIGCVVLGAVLCILCRCNRHTSDVKGRSLKSGSTFTDSGIPGFEVVGEKFAVDLARKDKAIVFVVWTRFQRAYRC